MIDAEADEVQRVADFVCDPPCELPYGGEVLRLPEPLLETPLLPELLNHVVEAPGQIPDLISAVHRQILVEIAGRHFAGCRYDIVNGSCVPDGQERRDHDTDGENGQGRDDAHGRVPSHGLLEAFDVDLEMDIAVMGLAGDDGDDDVVGLAFLIDGGFPEFGLDDEFLLFLAHRRADLVGVCAGDDLVGVADDGDLSDPFGLERGQILLQARLACCPPGHLLDAHLHGLSQLGRLAFDLCHHVLFGLPVDGDQGDQQDRGQEEHHEDELLGEGKVEKKGLEHPSGSVILLSEASVNGSGRGEGLAAPHRTHS